MKTVKPQHSIKYNDYLQLLQINCNLPKCPKKLINVDIREDGVTITTPKFSINNQLELKYPENIVIDMDSFRQHFNGNLLQITAKAHKANEAFRTKKEQQQMRQDVHLKGQIQLEQNKAKHIQKQLAYEAQKGLKSSEKQQQLVKTSEQNIKILELQRRAWLDNQDEGDEEYEEIYESEYESEPSKDSKQEMLLTKRQQMLQRNLDIAEPEIKTRAGKKNVIEKTSKQRLISNILTEKHATDENDLLLKLARRAQRNQKAKELGKSATIDKRNALILQQIEAKKKYKELKMQKKKQYIEKAKQKDSSK